MTESHPVEQATLGGGCFWCLEGPLNQARGVINAVSGYAGGHVENPTYEAVCTGRTGHAEVVQVAFEPDVLPYEALLQLFFTLHDPTQYHRQGPDVGPQYRSIILCHDDEQEETARRIIAGLDAQGDHRRRIVTEIERLDVFYPAEAHHQRFFASRPDAPYCRAMIAPKLRKAREAFPERFPE